MAIVIKRDRHMPRVRTYEVIEPPTSREVWEAAVKSLGGGALLPLVVREIASTYTSPASLEPAALQTAAEEFGEAIDLTVPARRNIGSQDVATYGEPEAATTTIGFRVTSASNPYGGDRSFQISNANYHGTGRINPDDEQPATLSGIILAPNETPATLLEHSA